MKIEVTDEELKDLINVCQFSIEMVVPLNIPDSGDMIERVTRLYSKLRMIESVKQINNEN